MNLSIGKLNKIFESKQFKPITYFTSKNYCTFIQLLCKNTGDVCMLYVQSKYNFELRPDNERVFDISEIDLNLLEQENIDQEELEKEVHCPMDIHINTNQTLQSKLLTYYKKPILLENKSKHSNVIKSIQKQLNRIKHSVSHLNYKCTIMFDQYICCLHRYDDVQCYFISDKVFSLKRKLYVSFDLEFFFKAIETIQ